MNTQLIFSDEHIEHWAAVFVGNNLYYRGLQFDEFILNPEKILQSMAFGTAMPLNDEFYPLLDSQEAVQQMLDQQEHDQQLADELTNRFERQGHIVELHGDRNIEHIHKRAHPKRWKTGKRRTA